MMKEKVREKHNSIQVTTADSSHCHYIQDILDAIYEASKVKGNSIVMRDPKYLAEKMNEGKAVIALDEGKFVGFCYIECWENERFVANSGLIVRPEYRGRGVAMQIKQEIFNVCRRMFPEAMIFGITKSEAVIKINKRLGFSVVPYSALTKDEKFWKGCDTCPHYQELLDNNFADCQCTGLLFADSNNS